jgi:hypothetical protein
MPNWLDEQIQRQRFADMSRIAEGDRLAAAMKPARPQHIRFYRPLLASLGRWLVAWGIGLQARYGPIAEAQVATNRRGNISGC